MNVLRVDMASGAMKAVGAPGEYRSAVVSWTAAGPRQRRQLGAAPRAAAQHRRRPRRHADRQHRQGLGRDCCPERFHYSNRHGDRIEGYVFKPAGWQASDKRPAVVYVYGGPLNDRHIVEVDSFQNTAYLFGHVHGRQVRLRDGVGGPARPQQLRPQVLRRQLGAGRRAAGQDLEDLVKLLPAQFGVDARVSA
jgi:hypothetical protein